MTGTTEELPLLDHVEEFDDFEEVIVHRRRMVTPVTWGLLFALGVALAFLGGVKLEKGRAAGSVATGSSGAALGSGATANGGTARAANAGGSTTAAGGGRGTATTGAGAGVGAVGAAAAGGTTGPGGGGGQAGAGGQGGQGSQAGGGTFGQVKLVDGTNIYVQDQQGNIVKVSTAPDLVVTVSKPGTVADLKPGDTVVVRGQAGADGTVSATSVATANGLGNGLAGRAGRNGGNQAGGG